MKTALVERRFLVVVVLLSAVSWAGLCCEETAAAPTGKPNVLIVLTDDQGYGDLSCHGNPVLKTPHLDKLHMQSIRLTDFHSAPVCTPTRGQLLTGRDAMHNGAWSWAFAHEMIRRDVPTIAHMFKANGYRTGHFGKWHLGDNYPYRPQEKGFHESVTFGGAATHQTPDYWQNDNFDDHYRHPDGTWQKDDGYCTDVWFDRAMDFMRRCRDKDVPFFCYLPTNAPHGPHYVADKYAKRFRGKNDLPADFFGMITNIDDNMGRVMAFLDKTDLADNTILIFMTDNGGTDGVNVYNSGMRGKKGRYYEGGHRVPCFIRWPDGNLGKARDIDELTQIQDLAPTLIDLCGLEVERETRDAFDGTNIAGLLRGHIKSLPGRMLVVQWSPLDYPKRGHAAVLWGTWRLVHDEELYNIARDPGQNRDVAAEHPEIVAKMQEHYAQWWKSVEPVIGDYARIVIGSDAENPSRLTCFEWRKKTTKANVTQQETVFAGSKVNGSWMLEVERPGTYRFELRRYPKEAATPMAAAFPATEREFKKFPACRALPVAKARLKIGNVDRTISVRPTDCAAVFDVDLPKCSVEMKTWLLDVDSKELCGAYYVDVTRQGPVAK